MAYKDPLDLQKYYEKNRRKVLDQQRIYQLNNQEKLKQTKEKHKQQMIKSSLVSLCLGYILDIKLWTAWFNAKTYSKKIASYDLSVFDAFDLMVQRCFYCGQLATTLDRLNSNLSHTKKNCVGCCAFCNSSKGAIDPKTFILRAAYRRTFTYYEDDDIWCDNKSRPRFDKYKSNAEKQKRVFRLTKEQFDQMIVDQCHYCQRHPSKNRYFGIDKIFPDDGYTLDNCVTACGDCNRAKWDANTDEFTLRDERITQRYLIGCFNELLIFSKNINHRKN